MADIEVRRIGLLTFIAPGASRTLRLSNLTFDRARWFDIAPLTGLHRRASLSMSVRYTTTDTNESFAYITVTNAGPDESGSVDVRMMRVAVQEG